MDYARPHKDSGIGFSYFPDPDHYVRTHLDRWLPRLQELGTSWLVLQALPTRPIPDSFLQRLMLADIEPVVMIKTPQISPLDIRSLRGTLRFLGDSGIRYVVLFDRPTTFQAGRPPSGPSPSWWSVLWTAWCQR